LTFAPVINYVVNDSLGYETFEKCFPLKAGFKYKEGENMSADASLRVTGGIY